MTQLNNQTQNSLFSSLLANRVKSIVLNKLSGIQHGYVHVVDASGAEYHCGDSKSSTRAKLIVLDEIFWLRIAFSSALGFGESYMWNEVEVENLTTLLKIFIQNREYLSEMNVLPFGLNKVINRILNSNIPNTLLNSRSNIKAHYDLGNDMFAAFLDPSLTYSCPIWKSEDESLEQAQYNKVDAMLDKALIRPTDHVLEIGTGWGTLAIRAVQRFGCKVTSLTLSEEQKILAEERIAKLGLSDSITVILQDYRSLPPHNQFDKIISVEMMEAVGAEFLPTFFAQVNALLKPQGIFVFQVITMPDSRYEEYLSKVDFIQKYIFPGGHCPSVTSFTEAMYKGTKGQLIMDSLDNIGPHYAKALRLWREAFLEKYSEFVQGKEDIYDEEFKRKWDFYFCYCEAGFATRTLGDVQVTCVKVNNEQLLEGIPM